MTEDLPNLVAAGLVETAAGTEAEALGKAAADEVAPAGAMTEVLGASLVSRK